MYFAHFVSKISKLRHKKAFPANFRGFSKKNESGLRLLVSVLTRMALLTGASRAKRDQGLTNRAASIKLTALLNLRLKYVLQRSAATQPVNKT